MVHFQKNTLKHNYFVGGTSDYGADPCLCNLDKMSNSTEYGCLEVTYIDGEYLNRFYMPTIRSVKLCRFWNLINFQSGNKYLFDILYFPIFYLFFLLLLVVSLAFATSSHALKISVA